MKALVDVLIRFGHVFILEIYIYIYSKTKEANIKQQICFLLTDLI